MIIFSMCIYPAGVCNFVVAWSRYIVDIFDCFVEENAPLIPFLCIKWNNAKCLHLLLCILDKLDSFLTSSVSHPQRNLTASPHIAGTPQDFSQADMLRQFWLDVGLDNAVTTPYNILLSYPDDTEPNILSLLDQNGGQVMASPAREASLTSEDTRDDIPFPNLGYSANGTVEVGNYS